MLVMLVFSMVSFPFDSFSFLADCFVVGAVNSAEQIYLAQLCARVRTGWLIDSDIFVTLSYSYGSVMGYLLLPHRSG